MMASPQKSLSIGIKHSFKARYELPVLSYRMKEISGLSDLRGLFKVDNEKQISEITFAGTANS